MDVIMSRDIKQRKKLSRRQTISIMVLFSVIMASLVTILLVGCEKKHETPAFVTIPEVTTARVIQKDVQIYREYTGYAKASEEVTVVARVKGFLDQILFTDGQMVEKGKDKLFIIEQGEYKANLEIAKANLQKAESDLQLTAENFKRSEPLVQSKTISVEEYDTRLDAYQKAIAAHAEAQANLDNAQRMFNYTEIFAPISGKISHHLVDRGNLVGGSVDTELATIRNMDPIYIYFQVSDTDYSMLKERLQAEGEPRQREEGDKAPIRGKFRMGFLQKDSEGDAISDDEYPYEGEVDYDDNTIDQSTGMLMMRGEIVNPNHEIYPGQICRIKAPTRLIKDTILVHEQAVSIDLSSHYILIINDDNKVERRNIELGELVEGNMYIVTKGLTGNETYIVEGLQKAKVGGKVKATPFGEKEGREEQAEKEEKTEETDSSPEKITRKE